MMATTVLQRKLISKIVFFFRCRMQSGCNSFLVDPSSSACYTGALTDQQMISDSTSAALASPLAGEATAAEVESLICWSVRAPV